MSIIYLRIVYSTYEFSNFILFAILLSIISPVAYAVFDIPLLYYYINLRSSIIFCLSSGDIYLSLGVSLSCSFVPVFELFCGEFFETLVILLPILLPIKSPVASSVF